MPQPGAAPRVVYGGPPTAPAAHLVWPDGRVEVRRLGALDLLALGPLLGAGPAAAGAATAPPPLPPPEEVKRQRDEAYQKWIVPYSAPETAPIAFGFGVKRVSVADAEAGRIAYEGAFRGHYQARMDWDIRTARAAGRKITYQGFFTDAAEWARAAGDEEMAAVAQIWVGGAVGPTMPTATLEVPGWFAEVRKWAGYAALGGVVLLGLVALNTVLPRD